MEIKRAKLITDTVKMSRCINQCSLLRNPRIDGEGLRVA